MEIEPKNLKIDSEPAIQSPIAGRFAVERTLGQRGGTRSYLAHDRDNGLQVVAKAIAICGLPQSALLRLEYEVNQLRNLQSDFLARTIFAAREREQLWLVWQYVEGCPLRERLQSGPLDVADTLIVGRALLSALRDLHQQRILHRGVRPGNIIINAGAQLQRATLVNCGAAEHIQIDGADDWNMRDLAIYASPEQAGSIEYDLTAAADLYSAGIVLFECLKGQTPFQGETVGRILFEHMTAPLPEMQSDRLTIPHSLDELIQRLLKKDPRDRYQSADAALADLEAIADGIRGGDADPQVVIGARDQRSTLDRAVVRGAYRATQHLGSRNREMPTRRRRFGAAGKRVGRR